MGWRVSLYGFGKRKSGTHEQFGLFRTLARSKTGKELRLTIVMPTGAVAMVSTWIMGWIAARLIDHPTAQTRFKAAEVAGAHQVQLSNLMQRRRHGRAGRSNRDFIAPPRALRTDHQFCLLPAQLGRSWPWPKDKRHLKSQIDLSNPLHV